jgi:hypothetical protein
MNRRIAAALVGAACCGAAACAAHRIPDALRGYDILVAARDAQSVELARAMRSFGYHVRTKIRGGNRPTAALIHFTFREPGPHEPTWLHVRLADTRSGVILGAAAIPIDSTTPTPRARAAAAVAALQVPNP